MGTTTTKAGGGAARGSEETGLKALGWSALVALALMAPIVIMGSVRIYTTESARVGARREAEAASQAYERLLASAPAAVLGVDEAARGRDLFMSACVACHGADARGVMGLGKDLTTSDYVAGLDDEGMFRFLVEGRPGAKPVGMPARAGREDLTDGDLRSIVVYLRGVQDGRRMPVLPEYQVASTSPTTSDVEAALAAAGGDEELAGWIASGTKLFAGSCLACHGAGGKGVQGNGKALVSNGFIAGLDDDGLLAFIKRGRDPSDPANTTGVGMPARGGNPALSDDDILDIISYLRTLQGGTGAGAAGGG